MSTKRDCCTGCGNATDDHVAVEPEPAAEDEPRERSDDEASTAETAQERRADPAE